jgi:hypothetical protein
MDMRAFGRTGMHLSLLGFGCGAVGGLMVRGDPHDQERTIASAIAAGVNYFDTAVQYGDGESEKNLGRVLRNLKASTMVVGTKVRLPSAEFGRIADAVAKSLEDSLSRLSRDWVDIFHLHNAITDARKPGRSRDSVCDLAFGGGDHLGRHCNAATVRGCARRCSRGSIAFRRTRSPSRAATHIRWRPTVIAGAYLVRECASSIGLWTGIGEQRSSIVGRPPQAPMHWGGSTQRDGSRRYGQREGEPLQRTQRQCISPQTASPRNTLTAASRALRSAEAASA